MVWHSQSVENYSQQLHIKQNYSSEKKEKQKHSSIDKDLKINC